MNHIDTSPAALRKPRRELLELAEKCGASLTGKPDGSESITVVFTIEAWRTFDAALLAVAAEKETQHHPEQPREMAPPADVPLPAHTISGPAGTGTYFNGHTDASLIAHREAYAKAAVAAERGRCAKLCKEIAERKGEKFFGQVISDGSAAQCERAIRAQKGTV